MKLVLFLLVVKFDPIPSSDISTTVLKLFTIFVPSQQVSSLFAADQVELIQVSREPIFQNPRDSST